MSINDTCNLATKYAERIMTVKDIEELKHIWSEINSDKNKLVGWYTWLIDIKDSQKAALLSPDWKTSLNKEGLKALERGEIG